MPESQRQWCDRRSGELRQTRRKGWEAGWRDQAGQFLQYRWREWAAGDQNTQKAKPPKIINGRPSRAVRIFVAGLVAGVTSPTRNWHKTTVSDRALKDNDRVRKYLDQIDRLIREALAQGGWYHALASSVYPDIGVMGTGAVWEEADPEGGVLCEGLTPGEYWIAVNAKGKVDTVLRESSMTVRTVVEEFGLDMCSVQTKNAYGQNQLERPVTVCQLVFPNRDLKHGKAGRDGMPWASRKWEKGSPVNSGDGGFLSQGGYEEFPAQVPRWLVVSREAYGRGQPGWEAVSDAKALQHLEQRSARLVDKTTDPPMVASKALRNKRQSMMPGDVTYVDEGQGGVQSQFRPAQDIPPQAIQVTEAKIEQHVLRIEQAFFVDLWLAMLGDQRAQRPTATEVERTREEVMLQLGPVLQHLNDELLEPAVLRTYAILARQGKLPPPPPELVEADGGVTIEFISIMHQLQKATGIVGIRELLLYVGQLAQMQKVEALDKIDADAIVDELADNLGVRPDIVLSDDQVAELRRAKAERQEAADTGDAMLSATEGARNLQGVDPAKMQEIAQMVTPAASAGMNGPGG